MSDPATTLAKQGAGCRYYGKSHAALEAAGVLVDQHGNECAVVFTSFAPCKMEIDTFVPNETICPIARGYARRNEGKP
jgi:hypothetical protein